MEAFYVRESEFDYLKWLKYCKVNCPEKLPLPYNETDTIELAPLEVALVLIGPVSEVGPECGAAYDQLIRNLR